MLLVVSLMKYIFGPRNRLTSSTLVLRASTSWTMPDDIVSAASLILAWLALSLTIASSTPLLRLCPAEVFRNVRERGQPAIMQGHGAEPPPHQGNLMDIQSTAT